MGDSPGGEVARGLVARLEGVLQERALLIYELERGVGGDAVRIKGRLWRLEREHERLLAELIALVPPARARAPHTGHTEGAPRPKRPGLGGMGETGL